MERFSWLQGKEKRDCESLMLCEAVTAIWVGGREEGLWVVATRKRETDKTERENLRVYALCLIVTGVGPVLSSVTS